MSTSAPPRVDCEQSHAGLAVGDVLAAADFYTRNLGFTLAFTWGEPPTFAGVKLDRVQIFLQQGTPNPDGSSVYFMVGDADALFEFQRANGVDVVTEPGDREYGIRDYTVRDLYGYALTFGHPLFNDGPPIPIERVDVPVRLEKRLAALLQDLARHKRMSVDSCLEEILLHTSEPLGDGVASPHTRGQLAYIQELKKKHGIDYDSHGSYRFVEE
ncbi:VOC family protein [Longimicrobium sp.]|uniref:VOC family protein n=1 Tax=Longimicrobium sp. TaxID=2029185 RepID=UPI002B661C0E|nr:VOC family protein [Longimicrobium sp.]HSU14083.1 VOC family protein [Longimicrobium sp.]